jgi:hypothetical protein
MSSATPPALVVALETDGAEMSWKMKNKDRGILIVQWTIAAQRSHPVFVDVLSRVSYKWKEAKRQGKLKEVDASGWTGPGAWTDAVLR